MRRAQRCGIGKGDTRMEHEMEEVCTVESIENIPLVGCSDANHGCYVLSVVKYNHELAASIV